jgi:hypothetical protein
MRNRRLPRLASHFGQSGRPQSGRIPPRRRAKIPGFCTGSHSEIEQ